MAQTDETTMTTTAEKTLDELLTARRVEQHAERERQYAEDKASYEAKMEQQQDAFTDALNADFSDALVAALHMEMIYEPPTTTEDDITSGRWVGRFTTPEGVTFTLAFEHRYGAWQWTLTSGKYIHLIGHRSHSMPPQLDTRLLDGILEYDAWRESHAAIEAAIANKPKPAPAPVKPRAFATVGDYLRFGRDVIVFFTSRNEHDELDYLYGDITDTNTHWVLLTVKDGRQRLIPIHQISHIISTVSQQAGDN